MHLLQAVASDVTEKYECWKLSVLEQSQSSSNNTSSHPYKTFKEEISWLTQNPILGIAVRYCCCSSILNSAVTKLKLHSHKQSELFTAITIIIIIIH